MDNEHRCILLIAFIYHDEIPWWDPEAHCCAIHPWLSCCSMIMHGPCCKDLYTIPGSWKHPSSCKARTLTGHVTHWACLGCSGSAYTTASSSSCQYPATSHSHWRGVDQHCIGHNQQPDQLCVKEMCCTVWGKWWSHQILTGFRMDGQQPIAHPLKLATSVALFCVIKLHILEWPFIVASLRHTCAIIMLSNQYFDMPHLWGGWIISEKEKCSLTQI